MDEDPTDNPSVDRSQRVTVWPAPPKSRWLLAVALVLIALVSVMMWGLLTVRATDATAKGFARSDLPGELTADLHPGVWNVYVEGEATVERVSVSYPDGRRVPVTRTDGGGSTYERQGFSATRVASFTLPLGGERPGMRVRVDGTAETPDVTFAVAAADELTYVEAQRWGLLALVVVNVGAAVAVVAVPILRRRRHRGSEAALEPGSSAGGAGGR